MSVLYENIERLMRERGINSLFQLSKMGYLSYSSLCDLRSGTRENLSTKNILKLAKLFDVSVDELTGTKKEPPESDPLTDEVIKLIKSLSEESLTKLIDYARLLLNAEQNQ